MKKSRGSFRFDVYFKIDEFQTQILLKNHIAAVYYKFYDLEET